MTGKPFASALISLSLVSLACTSRIVYEAAAEPATVGTVNINTASVAELEMLPGVGQKTAESIVEHVLQKALDELQDVAEGALGNDR